MAYVGYIPVPVWNGKQWQPRNFAGSARGPDILPWPDGFDPATLPAPPVQLRDRVRFMFGDIEMIGEITGISLQGGAISDYESESHEIARRYAADSMYLTIDAHGHKRSVSIRNLIYTPKDQQP